MHEIRPRMHFSRKTVTRRATPQKAPVSPQAKVIIHPLIIFQSRLADLDSKLNGLLARLSTPGDAPHGEHTAASEPARTDPLGVGSVSHELPQNGISRSSHNGTSIFAATTPSTGPEDDWLSRFGLEMSIVDRLLHQFRATQTNFPFVLMQSHWDASYMIRERPFLLLTALASTTASNPSLQAALGEEIKAVIARRIIFEGETNMDLFQGLLVYLAW